MSNAAAETLRMQFKILHEQILEPTLAGVTDEQARLEPAGKPAPIAAQYAHVISGEDGVFAGMIAQRAPLMMSTPTGLSEPPPRGDWGEWARNVKIDMTALKAYAQQVYAQTDAILAGMSDADLQQPVDSPGGKMPLMAMLTFILLNGAMHAGEISAIKGMQGHKGYPF